MEPNIYYNKQTKTNKKKNQKVYYKKSRHTKNEFWNLIYTITKKNKQTMKATKRISKNTIVNLINDVRTYAPGKLSALYDLSIYTDAQIEELYQRMEQHLKRNGYTMRWPSNLKVQADIASEKRDRKINKILG